LGVRDLRLVNLALFGKWRWRILAEGDGLWRSILSGRYGSAAKACYFGMRPRSPKSPLPWWKGASLLGSKSDFSSDWFAEGLSRVVRDGRMIFHQQTKCIGSMGDWREGVWQWDLRWLRPFFFLGTRGVVRVTYTS